MRRLGILVPAAVLGLLLTAAPALACGGLIGTLTVVQAGRSVVAAPYSALTCRRAPVSSSTNARK